MSPSTKTVETALRGALLGSRNLTTPRGSAAAIYAQSHYRSPVRTRRQPFSAACTQFAPTLGHSNPFGNSGSSSSPIPSYFSAKPSLPANTIIRFVPQQTAWIVERMGKFHRILQPGLAILIPLLDRIAYVKSLKENAIEIPSQAAITADNVTLELDGVLYTRVFDAYKAR